MRTIELESWSRRETFEFLSTWASPHFGLTANLDLTAFRPAVKRRGISFTIATTYVITRAANEIPEFRTRIRVPSPGAKATVVEHEVVHPSITLLTDDEQLCFCTLEYHPDLAVFAPGAAERIALVSEEPTLDTEERDDWLFMTSIPWLSFTGMIHPQVGPADCVPRFAWGKFLQQDGRIQMPLNVQAHHALMDGLHACRFFQKVQDYMADPDTVLGSA